MPQGTPEWDAIRKGKITGSIAYRLLGSFGKGEHVFNGDSGFTGSFATERGHLLEDEAIEMYEAIKNETVQHYGFVTNDAYPDAGYSPDGLTDSHVIEVKCFSEKNHLEIWRADSWLAIPKKILAQIQFGILITERQGGRLVIYNPKLEAKKALRIIEVPRVEKIQENFKRILKGVAV